MSPHTESVLVALVSDGKGFRIGPPVPAGDSASVRPPVVFAVTPWASGSASQVGLGLQIVTLAAGVFRSEELVVAGGAREYRARNRTGS